MRRLRSAKETELWPAIDYRYMTKESEGDDDTVHQHKLPWHSRGMLQYLCCKLHWSSVAGKPVCHVRTRVCMYLHGVGITANKGT